MRIRIFAICISFILLFAMCATACSRRYDHHIDDNGAAQDTRHAFDSVILNVSFSKEISNDAALLSVAEQFFKCKVKDMFGLDINMLEANGATKIASKYLLTAEAYIVFQSGKNASILFEGTYNPTDAAHPTHFLWSLNYDPITLERYRFSDMYKIDSSLYCYFQERAKDSILVSTDGQWPTGWGEFSQAICSMESFIEGLTEESAFQFYFGEESVAVIYPVPFSLGNYLVADIPLECLKPNETE